MNPIFKSFIGCVIFLSSLLTWNAFAQSNEKIKAELQRQFGPQIQIKSISPAPLPGLFEVVANNSVIYTDSQAKFLFQGSIVDLKTGNNLTEIREEELNRIKFSDLPIQDSIKVVRGDGSRKLAVFTDPNCGYCKNLEKTFVNMDNVTIYNFLIPILSADSSAKAKAIWCAQDPTKTWINWMVNNQSPPSNKSDCINPLEKNLALAKKLGINGTPAMFFVDGHRIPGAASKDAIEKKLAELSKKP
ncbi:MAG: DsbC family protein [Betaproteobacteria bacterium]|jgi:thiol:disulfide interchange protein DsbC|nr:DsbC family protein [Polynucleobacter sp.]